MGFYEDWLRLLKDKPDVLFRKPKLTAEAYRSAMADLARRIDEVETYANSECDCPDE